MMSSESTGIANREGLLSAMVQNSRLLFSVVILTLWGVGMGVIGLMTLFQARRLYSEILTKWCAKVMLFVWGVRVQIHQPPPLLQVQAIYISNHTSTLDIFVIMSMALPRCRYFLSGYLRAFLPVGVIAYMVGTFFTYPQSQPEKRVRVFQRADKVLRASRDSVYLSPEGTRTTTGKIGHFNKGAFHLATNLKVPIRPFFIFTPREIDPGKGLKIKPGNVEVTFMEPIPTKDWELEALDRNRAMVRERFIKIHGEHYA